MTESKTILVTGVAGFIGMHAARYLLELGHRVVGIDNLNEYYDIALKNARLLQIKRQEGFKFVKMDICDQKALMTLMESEKPTHILHLAAQAGVRYSITHPDTYAHSNLVGFLNILEISRKYQIEHLVYASSSSVYGKNKEIPFRESDKVDQPISLYAATKKSNELMAHSYSHLYQIPTTGLRFFTVYGPWGRPDMAPWLFADAILSNSEIKVFNHGKLRRDFTYIDDIVSCTCELILRPPEPKHAETEKFRKNHVPYRILNIGNNSPVELEKFICEIEKNMGKKAIRKYLEMQPGDVEDTYADTAELSKIIGFSPKTTLDTGVRSFCEWFKNYKNSECE